jgi:KipI family sensor histidine kinase inhibitor
VRLLPYGDRAVLVEVDDPADVLALHQDLAERGVRGLVPAARTLLVPGDLDAVGSLVSAATGRAAARPAAREVVLDVHYDGEDLPAVAEAAGCSVADVIARHAAAAYTVAFCGFAPGFAYLTGLPAALHVPRLASPRTRVPAGSVAIAGEYAGVYPRPSPGGWRLLGTTDAPLWDLERDPPALLVPGTTVRFRPA